MTRTTSQKADTPKARVEAAVESLLEVVGLTPADVCSVKVEAGVPPTITVERVVGKTGSRSAVTEVIEVGEVVDAVDRAEADARALHDAGRCGESEWSCSHCEAAS